MSDSVPEHNPAPRLPRRENGDRPLADRPVPLDEMPEWNFYYLNTTRPVRDPTIVWGTDVDCTGLQSYLRRLNERSETLVTPAHLLVAATGRALQAHPGFNRRILKRRLWDYRDVNVVMPFRSHAARGLNVMFLSHVDRKPITEIAAEAWTNAQIEPGGNEAVSRPFYMRWPRWLMAWLQPFHVWLNNAVNIKLHGTNHRQRAASTMVNYLGHRGMAPLRSFKPSRLPYESITLTVTMGATERRPAVVDGEVLARPVAPLFLRADHRVADANEIGAFAQTLRSLLADPERIEPLPDEQNEDEGADAWAEPLGVGNGRPSEN